MRLSRRTAALWVGIIVLAVMTISFPKLFILGSVVAILAHTTWELVGSYVND